MFGPPSYVVFRGVHLVKNVQNVTVLQHLQKRWPARGTFEEDLQRCISRGRHRARDMLIRDVPRPGSWFPKRGCILERQIVRFAKMISRDRCSTLSDLASLLHGRRNTLDSQLQLHYATLQLRLHNATLHPAVVGDVKDQIATATIATSPEKNTTLSVNQWIRSAIRASQQRTFPMGFPWFSYCETSATALCGTTGVYIYIYI